MNQSSGPRRLLIFGHVPPPLHGQSVMVGQLVQHFCRERPAAEIAAWHVDARFSTGLDDVGRARGGKLRLLFRHCRAATRLQREHAIDSVLLVPAPPANRTALIRDWLVLALIRRRFQSLVYYWQAAGLGDWLRTEADPLTRGVSRSLMRCPALSIVLGDCLRGDAEFFDSRRVAVVPNFMPDPCPASIGEVLPARRVRLAEFARAVRGEASAAVVLRVLFMSLCTASKGLFDTLDAVALVNRLALERRASWRAELKVAGKFPSAAEEARFRHRVAEADLQANGRPVVTYVGFADEAAKARLFAEADVLSFPTCYPAEAFPTVLVESMAWGLPVVATRWRALPEVLPPDYSLFVAAHDAQAVTQALLRTGDEATGPALRERFVAKFADTAGLQNLTRALLGSTA